MYDTLGEEQGILVWFERGVCNLDEVVVVLPYVVVDVVGDVDDGEDDVAVVLVAVGGNDAVIVHVQERHDGMVAGEYNFVGCKHHIGYFDKANYVDTSPPSELDVGLGAE